MEGGDLARLWKGGKKGCLRPLMQATAWGLSEAGVRQVDIAAKLEKIGGGHPTQPAVCKLLARISDDPEWYPGKRRDASYGPALVLRGGLKEGDRISLVTFDARVSLELPLTRMDAAGRAQAETTIKRLHTGSTTNLSGGALQAIDVLVVGINLLKFINAPAGSIERIDYLAPGGTADRRRRWRALTR